MNHYFIKVIPKQNENIINETLQRIGIKHYDKLYQTCHLLNFNNVHYIVHFKEVFGLYDYIENKIINKDKIKVNEDDINRRNNIIQLLYRWNLIDMDKNDIEYIKQNSENVYFEVIKKDKIKNYKIIQKVKL